MLDDEMRSATVTAKSRLRLISLGHFEVKRLKKDAPGVYALDRGAGAKSEIDGNLPSPHYLFCPAPSIGR